MNQKVQIYFEWCSIGRLTELKNSEQGIHNEMRIYNVLWQKYVSTNITVKIKYFEQKIEMYFTYVWLFFVT